MPGPTDFFSEDKLMNKLIALLIAGTFALGSVAMAQTPQGDRTPPQPVDQAKLKADRAAAKAAQANMTPEEKAAAKKAKRAARQKELSTGEKTQQEGGESQKLKADEAAKATAESKSQPKALPDKAARRKALTETEKKAGAGQ
jgi:colicin import membrane protein